MLFKFLKDDNYQYLCASFYHLKTSISEGVTIFIFGARTWISPLDSAQIER